MGPVHRVPFSGGVELGRVHLMVEAVDGVVRNPVKVRQLHIRESWASTRAGVPASKGGDIPVAPPRDRAVRAEHTTSVAILSEVGWSRVGLAPPGENTAALLDAHLAVGIVSGV
jgi:hypothetical protein